MARGDRREPIVYDDEDRELFPATFAEACEKGQRSDDKSPI